MERRDFLRYLGMGAGVLALPRWLNWSVQDPILAPPVEPFLSAPEMRFQWIVQRFTERLAGAVPPLTLVPGHMMGERGLMGVEGVDFAVLDLAGAARLSPRAYDHDILRPAVEALAPRLEGWQRIGALEMPPGVDEGHVVSRPGMVVRGVRLYDPMRDRALMRFDVIGG